jgi:hypothetical protein
MVSRASMFFSYDKQLQRVTMCGLFTDPEAYQIHCNNVGGHIDGLLFSLESADGTIIVEPLQGAPIRESLNPSNQLQVSSPA